MRYKYQTIARDGNGVVISGGTVSVYLAGTTTAASIYTSATSTDVVNSVTTSTDGSFVFYVDAFDYGSFQRFKYILSHTNFSNTFTEDNISVTEVISGNYTISTAKTFTYPVEIPYGVTYTKSGSGTITINGVFSAGTYQIFSGFSAGNVTFGSGAVKNVHPEWWGSDTAAFINGVAAASGGILALNSGTYSLAFSTTTAVAPPSNIVIEGRGRGVTTISFAPDSATFRNLFTLSNSNITFRNLSITVVAQSTQTLVMFNMSGSNLTFENCDFDGAMTNSGATLSHTAHCFGLPSSGTHSDINVKSCLVHRFSFGVLKANAYTSVQSRLSFSDCDFYSNYNEDLSFNSPNGSMSDVQIIGNRFRSGAGADASISQLYVSFASVNNFIVSNCVFSDGVADAIHIEEDSHSGLINNNSIEVDGNAIILTDNNIAGVALMPQHIVISENSIRKSGVLAEADKYGISLVYDVSDEVPAKNIVISGNTIYGFERGISSAVTLDDGYSIANNVVDACTYGFWVTESTFTTKNNISSNCTTGIYSAIGGAFDGHTFMNCTTNANAVDRPIVLTDPIYIFSEFNVAALSTTNKDCFSIGATDRVNAQMNALAFSDIVANYSAHRDTVDWDGSSFTRTNLLSVQPGDITLDMVDNSGVVAMQIYSAGENTNVRVQARLTGMVVVAP